MRGHRCKRSGDCCVIHWGSFEATHEDIVRWKRQGRVDILKHIAIDSTDPHNRHGVFVTKSCPFLKREETGLYSCAIHETKPFYCRIYPDDGMCEHEESIED
ncbi:MAG: YkgJ family cysteine cluster protein [Candidatus Bathyarchaeia archaeon]